MDDPLNNGNDHIEMLDTLDQTVSEEDSAGSGAISKHHYRRITVKVEIELEVLEVFLRLSGEDVTAGFLADGLEWHEPPRGGLIDPMEAYEAEEDLPDLPIFRAIEPGLADLVRVSYRDKSWPKSADAAEAVWKELFDDRYPDEARDNEEEEPTLRMTSTSRRKAKRSSKKA